MAHTPIGTPGRKGRSNAPLSPKASPGPCPYKGAAVTVPGAIFRQPEEKYEGTVKGWNGRRTDSLVVKFEDGTQYWFPLTDVQNWMDSKAQDAEPPSPFSPAPGSSPDSSSKGATLRQRTKTTAGESSKSQKLAAEQPAANTPQSDSGQQQHARQLVQMQQAAKGWLHRMLTWRNVGALCALALLAVLVLAGVTAGKGACHTLEACSDRLLNVYHGVAEKLAAGVRHHLNGDSRQMQQPGEVVVTTIVQEGVPHGPPIGPEEVPELH